MVVSPYKNVRKRKIPFWSQWLAAGVVFFMALMAGTNTGWQVVFIGKLNEESPPFEVMQEHLSWIASVVYLSRPIGIVMGIITTNYYGSKISLYINGFNYVIAWTVLIFAKSIYSVFMCLFLCGLGMGTYICIYPIYVSEIADPSIRGALGSLVMHGFMVGSLMGSLVGSYLEPWTFAIVNLGPAAVFLIAFFFFPSTPYHLILSKKTTEAEKSIRFYNRDLDAKKELDNLCKFLEANPRVPTLEALRRLNTPVNRKVTLTINVLYSFSQLCGIFAILEYLLLIFTDAKLDVMSPVTLIALMSVVGIPVCWATICLSETLGRTTFVFCSCVGFSVSFLCWGVHFYLLDQGFNEPEMQYLVIASAILYRISINVGFCATVPTMMSELYAPDVKHVGSCIANITSALCIFIASKNYQIMIDVMGYHHLFFTCAAVILAIGVYTKMCIPETKGKSLQSIQDMLCGVQESIKDMTNVKISNESLS